MSANGGQRDILPAGNILRRQTGQQVLENRCCSRREAARDSQSLDCLRDGRGSELTLLVRRQVNALWLGMRASQYGGRVPILQQLLESTIGVINNDDAHYP